MECFELIRTVLDEEYAQMPGMESEKDAAITNALLELQRHYAQLTTAGPCDYRDRATRFAYIYRYSTAHANLVYRKISQTRALVELFDQPAVEIACIGGGPGSDYLGILKFLIQQRLAARTGMHPRRPHTAGDGAGLEEGGGASARARLKRDTR